MGLSPLLVDTYRRYKRDTKTFTQWLGTTARATGLIEDVFEDSSEKQQGKPKGKSRRNRKPRKQAAAYKVLVNDLTRLATAIQNADTYKVPRHIMTVLADVIKARKGCAAWYRAHQSEESDTTKSHNEGHQHIIEVLETVYHILSPLEDEVKAKRTENPNADTGLANVFSLLEIEECPDFESDEAWDPTPSKKVLQASYEPETPPEDVSFALYCFMKDMTDIRIFVRRTWRECKYSQITINSAATTANAALNIMRRLNNAFVENFPEFAEHRSLIDYLYHDYVDPNAEGANIVDDEHFASYEVEGIRLSSKTFFCDHTAALLEVFFKTATLPMYQRNMMDGKGYSNDEHSLLQCLSHFNIIDLQLNDPQFKERMRDIFLDDQVLRAVRTMRVEKRFPTWAIFACQVFVDTRRELGLQLGKGFDDLGKQGGWLLQAWANCLETGKENTINRFHKYNDASMKNHIDCLKMAVESDFVQTLVEDSFAEHPESSARYSWGKYFLLKNHPLMCGLILQSHLVFGHVFGTRIAADQGPVRTAMHLTHAVTFFGNLPIGHVWADLEYIIKKHGDAYLFVGERPTKIFDCFRRMSLAFGSSASQFSVDKSRKADSRDLKRERDPQSIQKLHRRLLPLSRYVHASQKLNGGAIKPSRAAQTLSS
jgi:hypothetical protein